MDAQPVGDTSILVSTTGLLAVRCSYRDYLVPW